MNNKYIIVFIVLSLGVIGLRTSALAQTNAAAIIDADVQIGICGNQVIDGGEDCEGSNLGGSSCSTLGYSGGNLTCDAACTFDTTFCTSSVSTQVSSPGSTTPTQTIPITTPTPSITSRPSLPSTIQAFDVSGLGRILLSDLQTVLGTWVEEWKRALIEGINETGNSQHKKCDVNTDKTCDVKDFSVLLFYVDR